MTINVSASILTPTGHFSSYTTPTQLCTYMYTYVGPVLCEHERWRGDGRVHTVGLVSMFYFLTCKYKFKVSNLFYLCKDIIFIQCKFGVLKTSL